MDKELQRLLEEARSRGASTQQLDDILARYNSKKKEQPEEPFQFGVSDTESLSPSQETKESTEEVAVDRSPTIGEWFGNIWNGLSEGVTDFLYPAAESTGLTDKNILSFVKQNQEEYPDLFEAYEKSLSNSAIQSNFTGEKAEELAARTAYSQYWESDPSIEDKVVPFIRGERREEAVKKTGVEIPQDIKRDLDEQFWNSSLKGLASSLPAMVASSPTAGGSFVVQSYYAREEEIARTLDENPDLEMTEAQKEAYKVTGALVEGALEKIGLSGALKGSPALTKLVTAGVIDKALKGTKKVGKETLDRYINETVQEVGKRIAGGTLAEAETGALQQLSDDALKAVVNTAQGEEFFEPKSIANVFKDALYAGAQEAVGGGLISSVSLLGTSSNERKLKDIDNEIENLKQKRAAAPTEEEKTIIDDVITDLTEEQNKEREESFKVYSKFSEQDLIEVQELNNQIREVSSKYNVATSETLKDKYKQEVDDLRARKQELENKYSEEKDDSKEEERVPSTEQKEEAPKQAEPIQEGGVDAPPTGGVVQETKQLTLSDGAAVQEGIQVVAKNPVDGSDIQGTIILEGDPDNPRVSVETETDIVELGTSEDINPADIKPFTTAVAEAETLTANEDGTLTYNKKGNPTISKGTNLTIDTDKGLAAVSVFSEGKFVPLTEDADREKGLRVQMVNQDGETVQLYGQDALDATYNIMLAMNEAETQQLNKLLDNEETINAIAEAEESARKDSKPSEEAKRPAVKEARTEEVEITLLEENGAVKPLTEAGPTKDPRNVQTGKMTIEYGDKGITFKTTEDTGRMKEEGGEIFVSNEQISKMPNIGKFEKNTKEYAQHVASMSGIADPKSEIDPIERLMSKAVKAEDIGKEGTASAKRFTVKQGEQLAGMVNNFEKILKSSGARRVKVLFFNDSDSVAYRSYQSGKNETSSKGSYYRNTIVVNIDKADMSTLPHEMLHAYISSVKMDNKKIVQFTNAIENELSKGSDSERKLAKELAAFRDQYVDKEVYGKGKSKEDALIAEEFLAQYVGLLSTASENMPKAKQLSFIDKIRAAVVKFLSKVGIVDKNLVAKIKTREDALNFINGFVDALQGRVDPTAKEKVLDQTQPLTNAPVEISSSDVKQSRKQIVTEGTYIKESDLVDVKKLFSDFKKTNKREPKVWIWMSDQLKRGQYKNEKTGVSTTLEGGVGFAYDAKNKSKNIAWASGLSVKTLKERIDKADFIWFMAGSEKSSFNFSKGTTKTIIAEIEAGMSKLKGTSYNGIDIKDGSYDEFTKIAIEILKDDKTKKWSEVKKALNKGVDVINHPLRAKIAGSLLNAGTTVKMNLPIHQFLHETLGVPKLNEYHELIRDEFLKKNNYSNGDMSLIIKPTGVEADADVHDTYPHAVLGEVIGMPNKKNYVLDVVPEESKTVISKKTGLPIENAGTPVMIKTAVGDVGAIYEGKDLSIAREQIEFKGSEFINEFSWTEEVYEDGKLKKVTKTEKSDKPIAIRFPDGVVAVVRSRKDDLAAAEQMVKDVKKGMYPYMDIDEAETKRDRIRRAIKDKDVVIELVDSDMKYHKGKGYGRSAMPMGRIELVNNHYDYYFPDVAKSLGEDYKAGLMYSPDDTRGGDAVYIYDEFQGKGFGSRLYFAALRLLREQVPGARLISNHDLNVRKKAKNFWRSQVNNGLARVIANTATKQEIEELGGPEVLKQLKDIGAEYTGDIYELLDPAERTAPSKQYDVVSEDVIKQQIDWQPSLFGRGQVNPAIVNRTTDVQQAAAELLQGKITNAEYQEIVRVTQPIEAITNFYLPASTKDMKEALQKNKAELLNSPVEDGQEIGLRLDIPAYKDKNIWVVSVHGKGKSGKSISYGSVAQATDVIFGSNPKVASFIAAGKNMDTLKKQDKTTIARMLGKWKNFEGKTKEEKDAAAVEKVNEIVKIENSYPGSARKGSPWRQIGMNPFRHSYFYDRRNGKPVVGAAEVVQVGGLVYAKDVEYADWSDDQFTVNGYYDADGQPVRFQLDSDELTKIKDKAYAEIEKGKLSAPLYKKTWYQSAYNYLFRTELESKIVKLQEKKGSRIEESKKQGREIAAKIKKYAKTPEALKLANEYLVSENKKDAKEAILKLPKGQQLLNNLRSARAFIDNISNELVNDPAFDGLDDELRLAIQDNLSTYLRTQYRFFTDKKYNIDKRRKPAIDAQTNQLLAQEIGLLSAMGLSPLDISTEIAKRQDDIRNEAKQMIDGYISDLQYVKYQPSKGGAGIKMPSAAFKRKKELPEYIEQLLGKEKDPIKKFSQTSEALANILYKGRMIDGIIDIVGENSDYILDVEPSSPKDKQYTKVNDPYSKLNGKWVHNEVMDMVNQESLYSSDSIGWQMYYSLVRLSRKSKVIWNFPSSFRKNLTGGWFFVLTNGIINPKFPADFTRRTKRMFNVRGEKFQVDDETKRLASILADKGVTGASIDANLIGFSQATYQLGLDGDEGAYVERLMKVFNITSGTLSAVDSWLQEKYSSIDDYTKLIIFRSEIQTYAKKLYGKEYSELNEAQQDNVHEEAAERVKQSTPTFSRLPKWFNKIAAVPVVAPFISFTMESIRSYSMNVANGASDIKKSQDSGLNDVQKKAYLQAGLRRLSGAGAALALRYAIVKLMTQWFLDDEDEELADDVRALRPDWMSGHSIIPRSIDKDGNVKVYNYSTEDPYNDISNILQGPGSWGELIGGFVGPDIAADVIMNIVKNKDIYGGSIADYSDSKINQTVDLLMYGVDKIVIPPTLSSTIRDAWLKSDAPASEKSIEFFKTLGERSIIRDYKYNIISTFYQDINKISETRKTYEDYENPTKRLRQLDDIRKQYDAIVAIAFAKDNDDLIREAERALNNLDKVDREYVYEENR